MRSDLVAYRRASNANALAVLCGVALVHLSLIAWLLQPSQERVPLPAPISAIAVQIVSAAVSTPALPRSPARPAVAAQSGSTVRPGTSPAHVPELPTKLANVTPNPAPSKVVARNTVEKIASIDTDTAGAAAAAAAAGNGPSVAEGVTANAVATKPNTGVEPGVTAPRFDAAYLQNPAPSYPPLARRVGEQGKVVLQVYVEPTGAASTVQLHQSSGADRLDQSAISAVRHWKFVPAQRGAEPIGAWVLVPIVFNLKG